MSESAHQISEFVKTAFELLSNAGRDRIRAGDPEFVERAIAYLEADPYFDGTGYCKSNLVRYLKLVPFSPTQQDRLQSVVLHVIDTYGHYGGKHVCRLAASVQSPEFLSHLRERLKSPDYDIRRRARNVYEYVQRFNKTNKYKG